MAWFDEDWQYRIPLTFPNVGGDATIDGAVTIPGTLGKFWDNVKSDFGDLRITKADGLTTIPWAFNGTPSVSSKSCSVQIDGYDVSQAIGSAAENASVGAFLYWGNSGASTNADNSISPSNMQTLRIELAAPGDAASPIIRCGAISADQVYPTHRIRKTSGDQIYVWWDLSACVARLARPSNRSRRYEEIAYVQMEITAASGADVTSTLTTANLTTIGQNYMVKMLLKPGNPTYSPNKGIYLLNIFVGLTDDAGSLRVLDQRATLIVDNLIAHTS